MNAMKSNPPSPQSPPATAIQYTGVAAAAAAAAAVAAENSFFLHFGHITSYERPLVIVDK